MAQSKISARYTFFFFVLFFGKGKESTAPQRNTVLVNRADDFAEASNTASYCLNEHTNPRTKASTNMYRRSIE